MSCVKLYSCCVIINCLFIPLPLFLQISSIYEGLREMRVQENGFVVIRMSFIQATQFPIGHTSVVVGIRVLRIKLNNLIEIVFGFLNSVELLICSGPVVVGMIILGFFLDSLIIIFKCLLVIAHKIVVISFFKIGIDGCVLISTNLITHM